MYPARRRRRNARNGCGNPWPGDGDFDGTAVFIFQPAEEGLGGARAMIADGLFERFPCDEIYALHNQPSGPHGLVFMRSGAAMAAAADQKGGPKYAGFGGH